MNVTNIRNIQTMWSKKHDCNDIHASSSNISVILYAGVASAPSGT